MASDIHKRKDGKWYFRLDGLQGWSDGHPTRATARAAYKEHISLRREGTNYAVPKGVRLY